MTDLPITEHLEILPKQNNTTAVYVYDFLNIGMRLVVCLAAIWMGIVIAIQSNSNGFAILAALGCYGVIHALLGPKGE